VNIVRLCNTDEERQSTKNYLSKDSRKKKKKFSALSAWKDGIFEEMRQTLDRKKMHGQI
jgi:hypothetical protein